MKKTITSDKYIHIHVADSSKEKTVQNNSERQNTNSLSRAMVQQQRH